MHDFVFVKFGKKFSKIYFSEIIYAEAVKKYVRIVTSKKTYLILASLCSVETILPTYQFCRVHRSFIISFQFMTDFDNETVYIGDKIFPLGKQYKEILHERIITLSSDTKLEIHRITHSLIGKVEME
jgi:two-component system LytT family response regulator